MSQTRDFSNVFILDSEASKVDLENSLNMRLQELEARTYGLASSSELQEQDIDAVLWDLHHSIQDARVVFKALSGEIFPKEAQKQ